VDWVHRWWTTAGLHSPQWIGGGIDRRAPGHGGMLTGVGPPAAPGHGSSLAGVENGGQSTVFPFQDSPGLRWWCGGRSMAMKWWRRRSSAVAALKLRARGKRDGVGVVRSSGDVSLL
jgi:hypothetical protein